MPSTRRSSAKEESSAANKEKANPTWGAGGLIQNRELGSLALIILCPVFVLTFNYIIRAHDGSFTAFYKYAMKSNSFLKLFHEICPSPVDPTALKLIFSYSAFELLLMRLVPGKRFTSTITPTGHLPVYKANGLQSYTITVITVFALYIFDVFNPAIVYDYMGNLLSSMNMLALCLCAFLTFKGLNFPSTKDSGSNGSLIVDFFWGTELYPRVFGFDIKQFTNCRFGMMFWQVGILCFGFKQYETLGYISSSMLVSIVVQTVYITKFFWWETGYFCTMDIQHDRAGYYLCWGCLVWVPSMYTIHTYFLVEHPVLLSPVVTAAMLIGGIFSVWCNYDCDRQRQDFRSSGGRAKIWGSLPDFTTAFYTTEDGETRQSLLLASGWWGISRHFHYVPEVAASFFWCAPALFTHLVPHFYYVYLAILLLDRAWRDDARCGDKYKKYWEEHCAKVPYKVIPGLV